MIARVRTDHKDRQGYPLTTEPHYEIIKNDKVPGLAVGFNPTPSEMYCWVGGKIVFDDGDRYKDLNGKPAGEPYMNVQPAGRMEIHRVDVSMCSKEEREEAYKILSERFPEFKIRH